MGERLRRYTMKAATEDPEFLPMVAIFDEVATRRRPRQNVLARMLAYQAYSHWALGNNERAVHAAEEAVALCRGGVRDAPTEHADVFADRLANAEATLRRVSR